MGLRTMRWWSNAKEPVRATIFVVKTGPRLRQLRILDVQVHLHGPDHSFELLPANRLCLQQPWSRSRAERSRRRANRLSLQLLWSRSRINRHLSRSRTLLLSDLA